MRAPDASPRLGFLSTTAYAAGAATLAVLAAWAAVMGPGLFSPGSLSAATTARTLGGVSSHARIRGCDACHTAPWSPQTMADRCLACHTDIAAQTRSRTGLHGRLARTVSSTTCRGCHTEHHGAKGALTDVNEATFPHELTGYSLAGHRTTAAGARVGCTGCHPDGLGRFTAVTCSRCHAGLDARFMRRHESAFGAACLDCHDGTGSFGSDFDHGKLRFELTGKHVGVACARCHTDTRSLAALRDTPQDCYSCHARKDEHRGAFGKRCDQCHSTAGWEDATFDHAVFPLDHGREERKAVCATCHPKDITSYTCYGCHEHTAANVLGDHEGRRLADLTDCIKCHRGGSKGED